MSRAPVGSRTRMAGLSIVSGGGGGGGTRLGAPLQTRTVQASDASPANGGGGSTSGLLPATPQRATRPTSTGATHTRTPSRTQTQARATPSRANSSTPQRAAASIVASSSSSSSALPASSPSSKPRPAASPQTLSRSRYDATKASDPFATRRRFKTSFSEAYANGSIPCRINHGSVHHKLQWHVPSSELDYSHLLPIVADGLVETEHPYVLVARKAWVELLREGGAHHAVPVLPKLVHALRRALIDPAPGVFDAACDAVVSLSATVGPELNSHLDLLISQIHKKSLHAPSAAKVNDTLLALAEHGGDEAAASIKRKVPTFAGL